MSFTIFRCDIGSLLPVILPCKAQVFSYIMTNISLNISSNHQLLVQPPLYLAYPPSHFHASVFFLSYYTWMHLLTIPNWILESSNIQDCSYWFSTDIGVLSFDFVHHTLLALAPTMLHRRPTDNQARILSKYTESLRILEPEIDQALIAITKLRYMFVVM